MNEMLRRIAKRARGFLLVLAVLPLPLVGEGGCCQMLVARPRPDGAPAPIPDDDPPPPPIMREVLVAMATTTDDKDEDDERGGLDS